MIDIAANQLLDMPGDAVGTSLRRVCRPLLLGLGMAGVGLGHPNVDKGTRIGERVDVTHLIQQTSLDSFVIDTPVIPYANPTPMQRIIDVAPLSRRTWADVFAVSPNAIQKWTRSEPNRPKVDQVLVLLERASLYHADLNGWLGRPVGRSGVTPLTLLRDSHWRAFEGAVRTQRPAAPQIGAAELLSRRRAQLPWAVPEPPSQPDES